jgi:hypothetical protein
MISVNSMSAFTDNVVLKIALAQTYTDLRNWWIFKEVETRKNAEVDPYLDNGRTAEDTAAGDIVLQAVLFELALPPASASKPFEL